MPEVPLDDASTEALYAYLVNTAWSAYEDAVRIRKRLARTNKSRR